MTDIFRVLDAIEELDKAATNGPWRIEASGTGPGDTRNILGPCGDDEIMVADIHAWNVPDAALIAHYRTSCPRVGRALRIAVEALKIMSLEHDECGAHTTVNADIALDVLAAIEKELGSDK